MCIALWWQSGCVLLCCGSHQNKAPKMPYLTHLAPIIIPIYSILYFVAPEIFLIFVFLHLEFFYLLEVCDPFFSFFVIATSAFPSALFISTCDYKHTCVCFNVGDIFESKWKGHHEPDVQDIIHNKIEVDSLAVHFRAVSGNPTLGRAPVHILRAWAKSCQAIIFSVRPSVVAFLTVADRGGFGFCPEVDVLFDACLPQSSVVLCWHRLTFTQDHPLHAKGLHHLIFASRIRECSGMGASLIITIASPEFCPRGFYLPPHSTITRVHNDHQYHFVTQPPTSNTAPIHNICDRAFKLPISLRPHLPQSTAS